MVQIIPAQERAESFGSLLGRNLGAGLGQGVASSVERRQQLDQQIAMEDYKANKRLALISQIEGTKAPSTKFSETINQDGMPSKQTRSAEGLMEKARQYAALGEHDLANIAAKEADAAFKESKEERRQYESDRSYNGEYSKEAEKKANNLRESLPRKEMALDFARNSVETGDLNYFSPDKLADITGVDLFRTAKGSQLITAGKENLLSNMSRVSARAQNQWFEQRLNSMFPKIGQSKEANLTVQEMLEGEASMDKAYLSEFDRLSNEDQNKYGFVRKDIEKRVRDATKPLEKEILKRTTYRMRELEEQELGLNELKSKVGKKVVKDTPLTLAMAKLYKEKFGENALKVAKESGYYIPTAEEFVVFRSRPQSYREGLTE